MKWKKSFLVKALVFLCVFYRNCIISHAEEFHDGEVIILVDVSGTMQRFSDTVEVYAEYLENSLKDSGVKVTWKAFANPGYIEPIYYEWTDDGNEKRLITEDGKCIEFDEDWTDHKGAFEYAVNEIEHSEAQWKSIVMLSDAILDYDNDEYDKKEDEEAAEEKAKNEFVEMVNKFAEKPGQRVVLVYFGNTCDLFKRCEEKAIVLNGEKIPENGLSEADRLKINKELMEKVVNKTLEGVGFESDKSQVSVGGNQAGFSLDKDAYRVILSIHSTGSDSKNMDISIKREDNGQTVEPYSCSQRENSGLFYLADVQKGKYVVTFPEGEWQCDVNVYRKISIYDVVVSVMQDNNKVAKEGDKYCVDSGNFILDIQVKTNQDGESETNLIEILYGIVPVGDWELSTSENNYESVNGALNEDSGSFQPLVSLEDGEYECRVKIKDGQKVVYESESTFIRVDTLSPTPTPTPTPTSDIIEEKCIYTGEMIDVRADFEVPEDDGIYYIKLDGEDFARIDGENTGGDVQYKNGKLSFAKKGTYKVSVVLEGDLNFEKEKRYKVDVKCWLKKIWDMLFGTK